MEKNIDEFSELLNFYKNKCVFITGATGFFGKTIIEKLLRTTQVQRLYLLIRTKKGKTATERLNVLFDDPIFDLMKKNYYDYFERITVISGDCSLPALGISEKDQQIIKNHVNIIIHTAATVKFDETLKLAIAINVNGTRELLKLSNEIKCLKAFVHVSTAFAHCNRKFIEEKFYDCTMSGDTACKLMEISDEATLNRLTPDILKEYPNTYTFTKCLAENVVKSYGKNIPIAIIRPGIVVFSYKEPIPGWIDNMYGPVGIYVGIGTGTLRLLRMTLSNPVHFVPVDFCVSALLVSAWDVAINKYKEPRIYNYSSDPDNLMTWQQFREQSVSSILKTPFSRPVWYPTLMVVHKKWLFNLLAIFCMWLPALLMDMILLLFFNKPQIFRITGKVQKFCGVLEYFMVNEFRFNNENVRNLSSKLNEVDRNLFEFDLRIVDLKKLIKIGVEGVRIYIMKENPKNFNAAMQRNKRLKILHYSMLIIFYSVIVIYFIYFNRFSFI